VDYWPPLRSTTPRVPSNGRSASGQQGDAAGQNRQAGTLTEDQFNSLPEIHYKPIASHYDEDNEKPQDADTEVPSSESASSDGFVSAIYDTFYWFVFFRIFQWHFLGRLFLV
jgi:hypothetical protein